MNGEEITEIVATNGKESKRTKPGATGGLRGNGQGRLLNDITEGQNPAPGRRPTNTPADRPTTARTNRAKV